MYNKSKILLIDDDKEFVSLLSDHLGKDGFDVTAAYNGEEGLALLEQESFDFCVLDVMMPVKDGIETLKEIRSENRSLPVLMLTAKAEPIDRIVGLELGADDYMAKPLEPRELTARVKAILRRSQAGASEEENPLHDKIRWDDNQRQFFIDNEEIFLTGIEYEVLKVLAAELGNIVPKEHISEEALKRPLKPFDRSLDVHISNIRKKLIPFDVNIKSVRGRGYQLIL